MSAEGGWMARPSWAALAFAALCNALQPGTAAGQISAKPVAETVFVHKLQHVDGQQMTGVLVEYPPGAASAPHCHTTDGMVVVYVLEGAIRSQVDDGAERIYRAGDSWVERPGAQHPVSENASKTEMARMLAVFVAAEGAVLTTRSPFLDC